MLPSLDKDLESNYTIVRCAFCRNDLWKITQHKSAIAKSVINEPIPPVTKTMEKAGPWCPICNSLWYIQQNGKIIYKTSKGDIVREEQ